MLGNVQAQSNYEMDRYDKDPYGNSYEPDYGNDNRYDSYEPDYGNDNRYDSYQPEYADKAYNNYKPDHYGMNNDYYDKKPYGYEPKYSSYGKDDKSKKDDSSKVEINKIKCINTNININGNNAGNVSLGNKGTTEEQGYLGTYSSGGYYDGNNNKLGKGFDCTINNNNNNTN